MEQDGERITEAFRASGFRLVEWADDRMLFRADNIVRRLTLLGRTVSRCGSTDSGSRLRAYAVPWRA